MNVGKTPDHEKAAAHKQPASAPPGGDRDAVAAREHDVAALEHQAQRPRMQRFRRRAAVCQPVGASPRGRPQRARIDRKRATPKLGERNKTHAERHEAKVSVTASGHGKAPCAGSPARRCENSFDAEQYAGKAAPGDESTAPPCQRPPRGIVIIRLRQRRQRAVTVSAQRNVQIRAATRERDVPAMPESVMLVAKYGMRKFSGNTSPSILAAADRDVAVPKIK